MKSVCSKSLYGILVLLCTVQALQAEHVCKNGGETLSGNYPKCSCPRGYKGFDCNQKVTPCEGEPCRNSVNCTENENGIFSCECLSNFAGLLCERRVRPCDSQPCKNGGNCSDGGLKCFKCECRDGFKGFDCSKKISPCEVSPCENGGICLDEDDGFKCACINGFAGLVCTQKDTFYLSYILDGKVRLIEQLQQWLTNDSDWRLCYRASRDGWGSKDFHSRCDYKAPTVTLIHVGYYIFGGYSDVSWGGPTVYKTTTNSFLFSLRNKDHLKPFKCPVYQNKGNAIYQNAGYGPTFGAGHDLYIKNNAGTTTGSYSNLGHTYKPPTGYVYATARTKALLAGSYNFIPTEVEVFYLQ